LAASFSYLIRENLVLSALPNMFTMKRKGKILVLDNDLKTLTQIYVDLLMNNYEVELTMDATEVVPRSERLKPDVIIVNNDVPHFDGRVICKIVKGALNIPILLLSEQRPDTLKIDGCSADEIIYKPVDLKQLNQTILRFLPVPKQVNQ
jgi:DNA-binding response OmpR family regulator